MFYLTFFFLQVWIVSLLASENTNKVAFYKETGAFVKWTKRENQDLIVVVTGHSLGGGLALITGALTNFSSVAISGPNSMLSRDTFGIAAVSIPWLICKMEKTN